MITAAQAGLTTAQYEAIQDHADGAVLNGVQSLVLTRYAPVWKKVTSPFAVNYIHLNTGIWAGALRVAGWNGSTAVLISDLPNEDAGDQAWTNTTPGTFTPAPRALSFFPPSGTWWSIATAGAGFKSPIDGCTRAIASYSKHMYLAAVGTYGWAVHLIGLTSQGNWQLAYYNAETIGAGTWTSGIYWPYQVRSFDAVRMDGYDIIAMETDLPPIDDVTVVGTKTTVVAQRVQGIIIFKFDYTNHLWSSHYVLDVVDNQHDRSLGHIKLTKYGDMVYATFFKNHNGNMVLCITRSADGLNWENPIYLSEMADSTLTMAQHYPVSLVRNGKYMYLIGAGSATSHQLCYRALATDYMGTACLENTLDVTDYVTNVTLSVDTKRAASVTLGDPTINVAKTGYGLTGLLRGTLTDHILFSGLRAMRARLSLGYNCLVGDISAFTLAHYPVLADSVAMSLVGYAAVTDDGHGSLRPAATAGTDTAAWVKTSVAGLVSSTHTMNNVTLVPDSIVATENGNDYTDDGVGNMTLAIPGTTVAITFEDTFIYPVVPITPGACTLYGTNWSVTDDGYGAFADVGKSISGTIDYATGDIVMSFVDPAYVGPPLSDFVVGATIALAAVDYEAGIIVATGMTLPEAYALDAAAYTFAYDYAAIYGTIVYATGACAILVDGIEEITATYDNGGAQSETIVVNREDVLVEQLYGIVSKVREAPGLEGSISLEIQDLSVLSTAVGNSDSNEWLGVDSGGDNFAPLYVEDTSGTSAMGHTIPKTGSWVGSSLGLKHACDDDEGLAITDIVKRSMNTSFQADIGFYCGIQTPVKLTGGTAAAVIDGHEYAGLGVRMKDQHSGWWVRITPGASVATFQLMFRRSVTTKIPGVDGKADTYEVTHVDTAVPGATATGTIAWPATYDAYYVGKVLVRAYYNKISCRVMVGQGATTSIFSHEALGMGDLEFLRNQYGTTYPKPTLEGGLAAWPFMSGYCAYIAKGTGLYVDHGDDAAHEIGTPTGLAVRSDATYAFNTDTDYTYESVRSIQVTTANPAYQDSGITYTKTGLSVTTGIRFSADIWIESGDENAVIRAKAKVVSAKNSSQSTDYTVKEKWHHFEWTCENPDSLSITQIIFFFTNTNSDKMATPTVFYVDNIKVAYKETQNYIYFGNAMNSDDERCYTVEDAQKALYAYSGQHDVYADDLLLGAAWSGTATTEVASSPLLSVPLVVDFDMTSDYAAIYPLAVSTVNMPIAIIVDGGYVTCQAKIKPAGADVKAAFPLTSAKGRLRAVVTTLSSTGEVYTQDTSLAKDWMTILVYLGDKKILSGVFPVHLETVLGDKLCFGLTGHTMSFSSLRVSIASRVVETFSIDPGESASNPLGRLLGTANLVPMAQPDGGLRLKSLTAWPLDDLDWVLPGTTQQVSREVDLMSPSHVRYTAARDERNVFINRARALTWAHFFEKKDDPNAITESEMETGELGIAAVVRRGMNSVGLGGVYNPFLELDDTVGSAVGDAYLVDGINVTVAPESNGATMVQAKYKLSGDWFTSLDPDDKLDGGGEDNIPPVLTATPIADSQLIDLTWTGTPYYKTGFIIERSTDGVTFAYLASVDRHILIYTDSGLPAATLYYYRVCAYNALGYGTWSNIASATTDTLDMDVFPVTHILDDFNRADQGPPPGSGWTVHATDPGDPTRSWSLKVVGQECIPADDIGIQPHQGWNDWDTVFTADCEAYFTITDDTPSTNPSPPLDGLHSVISLTLRRGTVAGDSYNMTVSVTGTVLYNGGNVVGSSAEGWAVGDQFGMRCWGDQIVCYKNGVAIITVTDSLPYIASRARMYITCSGQNNGDPGESWSNMAFDDFGGGNL